MLSYTGNAFRLYSCFRTDLERAARTGMELDVFSRLLPSLNARTAAVLTQSDTNCRQSLSVTAHIGLGSLWPDYLDLCRTNQEPISRVLRLSPHPVALSDLRRHPRLRQRSTTIIDLLRSAGLSDAFAVPAVDQQLNFSMIIFAGHNLALRPTKRHLLTQVATDLVVHVNNSPRPLSAPPKAQHHSLTRRQMEIATWLIAGKTDWEIGEILRISPKTVNFHVENIKRVYGVKSRNQFIAAIVHEGGLRPHRHASGARAELSCT